MLSLRYNETVVRRVRLKCPQLDPLAARLRLENVLQTVELHPAWLSPSAIVLVRRLRDPLPHTLDLQSHHAPQTPAWQRAVSAALEETIRRAVLPADAKAAPDAEAVIFRDQAELLACLATDWCEGLHESHWWWKTLFKGGNVASRVLTAWSNAPEYVPAALDMLAIKGRLKLFADTLSAAYARELLRDVTRSIGLKTLQVMLDEGFDLPHDDYSSTTQRSFSPPWHSFAPESLDHSPVLERQCLIGVALTIRRAPAVARSPLFAPATLKWLRATANAEFAPRQNSTDSQQTGSVLRENELHITVPHQVDLSGSENAPAKLSEEISRESEPSPFRQDITPAPEMSAIVGSKPETARPPRILPASQTVHSRRTDQLEFAPTSEISPLVKEPSFEAPSDVLALDEVKIETEFGGVFYLINAALFLGLYGDFTTPAETGLTLPIFDFVTLTAQRLLKTQVKDDPVWELLAQLAGRNEIDPPGQGFEPSEEWRLPAQWLEAFPESALEWAAEGERLRVRHPSGFLLIDVPLAGNAIRQLKRELMVYDPNATLQLTASSCGLARSNNSLEQWLDWVVPYLRARLGRAFGIAGDSKVAQRLCAQRATIVTTAVHLDIFFSLAEHPLEIRSAGLDRDPGWVPAAGRFIRFHYQ